MSAAHAGMSPAHAGASPAHAGVSPAQEAHILHLDLDAFFASVEQRDKPSLRGKPVLVGGTGGRGVVSTASYEARVFGVHSALAMSIARRRAPHAAVLGGRFGAYRQSSRIVMALLAELSPLVEPLSLDEAYVDLAAGGVDCSSVDALAELVRRLRADVTVRTEGLHASVGVGTSKLIAKIASEAAKPDGQIVVPPGAELDLISPLPVRAIPGIGPATVERLALLNVKTVADLQAASPRELAHELGENIGAGLVRLAFAQDDRRVQPERDAKSISTENTFATDLTSRSDIEAQIDADALIVARSLAKAGVFARTITLKIRLADFSTHTRSRTLDGATDRPERLAGVGRALLDGVDVAAGVRLVGLGASGFTEAAQEELFAGDEDAPITEEVTPGAVALRHRDGWYPGQDVVHFQMGRGWVWGSGRGRVTVRFETRLTGVGPVRTFAADDPALTTADLLPMAWDRPEGQGEPDPEDAGGGSVG